MEKYKELSYEEVTTLAPNTVVYITWCGHVRQPAFIMPHPDKKDGLSFLFGDDVKNVNFKWFPFETYKTNWKAEVQAGITVETPDGTLHAYNVGGDEYPGIAIDLYRPDDPCPIGLSLTEYISGGECLCGLDPKRPELSDEEIAEVPVERIMDADGNPVTSRDGISRNSDHRVSAGLVTRAWPDEVHNKDYHKRVFHIGYGKKE